MYEINNIHIGVQILIGFCFLLRAKYFALAISLLLWFCSLLLWFRSCYVCIFGFVALMSHLLRSRSFSYSVFASSSLCDNSIGTLGIRPIGFDTGWVKSVHIGFCPCVWKVPYGSEWDFTWWYYFLHWEDLVEVDGVCSDGKVVLCWTIETQPLSS